jgi:Protein of unknown function (DUF3467)
MADDPISASIPEESKKRPLHFSQALDFVRAYANQTVMLVSPWDIQLVFGEIIQATEEKMDVASHAHITITPEHAKAVYELLGTKLQEFEQKHRKIGDLFKEEEREDIT